jgi:gamma-glutamyltranspeptidase / glutathione hydrolase
MTRFLRLPSTVLRLPLVLLLAPALALAVPVEVRPVAGRHGMVVAGHPEASAVGVAVLQAGGNAVDAAVAVSLALGIAEPYGSGLGGKLMLLYHDAKTGRTFAVDGMDQASHALDATAYRKLDTRARYDGWTSVCIPGLAAGLETAHRRWGALPWKDAVAPAERLAREGFTVLAKTRDLFEERLDKLRGGDADLARLYLPGGRVPEAGSRLPNPDLAETLAILGREGAAAGFYRGPVAEAIVAASTRGGGFLTLDDLARYEARVSEPVGIDFRGYRILGGPPPTTGAAISLGILKALEPVALAAPLRSAETIDLIGRVWREVQPAVQRTIADTADARRRFEVLTSPEAAARVRERAGIGQPAAAGEKAAFVDEPDPAMACTTHFAVVDRWGNIVCATQSQSLHFGAGVVAAGVIMNDSMSNFAFTEETSPNLVAPGRRPRSTITPTLVFRDRRPVLAVGIPGAARIPTAVLQFLVDVVVFERPVEEAIGDTRIHWHNPLERGKPDAIETERSLDPAVVKGLEARGWEVSLREPAGTGRHFGGLNVIAIAPDGTLTGYADPRRTNAAVGY